VSSLHHAAVTLGPLPLIAVSDWWYTQNYREGQADMSLMSVVRAILDLCEANDTRVIALINPLHADELEVVDLSGHWPALEAWKRALTTLVTQYAVKRPGRVELWDFCGYDAYSSEPVPKKQHNMRWFWNTSHYTRALGEVMLSQIFRGEDPHFGTRLSPANIESRLAEVRLQQRRYHDTQPGDALRVQEIYDRAVSGRPRLGEAVSMQ
jgi:hypothetical protein